MATDSSVAGFLVPSSEPVNDDSLDDLLQAPIVGITGIPGPLVRPRWQPEPPVQPDFDVDWCAFGITRTGPDVFSYQRHDPVGNAGAGQNIVERDELLYVLHSFYGPNCARNIHRFRSGLDIEQNRATIKASGIVLVEAQDPVNLPALLKEKWVQRIDMTVVYRRRTATAYRILTLQSGQMGLDNELYVTPITVNQ